MANHKMKALIAAVFGLALTAPLASAQAQGFGAEQSPAPRAIQCSAALELMARAAPRWSNQAIAQQARYFWRQQAEQLAGSVGRNPNTEIGQEMGLLAEQAVQNPNALSDQATLCLSDVPGAGNVASSSTAQPTQPHSTRRRLYQSN